MIQHNRLFFGLFALDANGEFHYPKYFSMLVFGPEPLKTFSKGYFDLAMAQTPKPKTLAIVAADAEFAKKAWTALATTQGGRAQDCLRPHLPADHRGFHADHPPPCRRPIRTSSTSPRIRPTRSASCTRLPKSGSRPTCSAAPLSACRQRRSRPSSGHR